MDVVEIILETTEESFRNVMNYSTTNFYVIINDLMKSMMAQYVKLYIILLVCISIQDDK